MSFYDLAKARYSVRKFSDKKIEQEKLDKILLAGRIAPTAKNNQPQRVYVLKSGEAMEKVNKLTRCVYGAPLVLLVCYDETEVWHNPQREGYNTGEVDASIVCTHMMLEAWEQGIGSCWVGVFNDKEVSAAYNLPGHIKPVALMPLGYAAEDAEPAPRHDEIRDEKETVSYL